jgi:hypothetical protein
VSKQYIALFPTTVEGFETVMGRQINNTGLVYHSVCIKPGSSKGFECFEAVKESGGVIYLATLILPFDYMDRNFPVTDLEVEEDHDTSDDAMEEMHQMMTPFGLGAIIKMGKKPPEDERETLKISKKRLTEKSKEAVCAHFAQQIKLGKVFSKIPAANIVEGHITIRD